MKVLLVQDSKAEAVQLSALLRSYGHEVDCATGLAAIQQLTASVPDMVIADWVVSGVDGPALAKHIRGQDFPHYVYFVMLTANNAANAFRVAMDAGADDFVRKPVNQEDLRARLNAAERILRLETNLRSRVKELESALNRLDISAVMKGSAIAVGNHNGMSSGPMPDAFTSLRAWRSIDTQLAAASFEYLPPKFEPFNDVIPICGEKVPLVTLSDVAHGVEMDVVLLVDPASTKTIAKNLFGDAADVDTNDLLLEMSNMAMGGVKASFAKEKYVFTGSIPQACDVPSSTDFLAKFEKGRVLGYRADGIEIVALVGVKKAEPTRIPATELKEGMILAKDVKNGAGMLLLKAGYRLSSSSAERLHKLGSSFMVELVQAGAA